MLYHNKDINHFDSDGETPNDYIFPDKIIRLRILEDVKFRKLPSLSWFQHPILYQTDEGKPVKENLKKLIRDYDYR